MEETKRDIKRSKNEEDEAIARSLAGALCEDDAEKFLEIYDEIPATISHERLDNIKEMARQVAALRNPYRHSPMPGKDSSLVALSHPLPTLNSQKNSTDLDAFKTPPEGGTPVDTKHFDYTEETLKKLQDVQDPLLSSLYQKQMNDSGYGLQESLVDRNSIEAPILDGNDQFDTAKTNEEDTFEYHTPPEAQDDESMDPPFGYPRSPEKFVSSVIDLLSKSSTNVENKKISDNKSQDFVRDCWTGEFPSEKILTNGDDSKLDTMKTNLENDSSGLNDAWMDDSSQMEIIADLRQDGEEKDSLDGSPTSGKNCTQEEDDSGISIIDESDILQEANGTCVERASESKISKMPTNHMTEEIDVTHEIRTRSFESDSQPICSNFHEPQDSTGWQTRSKRFNRKRHDREFKRHSENCDYNGDAVRAENGVQQREPTTRMASRERKSKERNGKWHKSDSNKVPDKSEDNYRERTSWPGRDADLDRSDSPKRYGRRVAQSPHGGKRSDSRWSKNGFKDRCSDKDHESQESPLNADNVTRLGGQSSIVSYRDAVLKAGLKGAKSNNSDETASYSKADRGTFDLGSAVNYLSSVWMDVVNLHRKDHSKVFMYNGE